MAQEKLMIANEERELIFPSRNEILAQKMRKFREENHQKVETKRLKNYIDDFNRCFIVLMGRFFNLEFEQLGKFSPDEFTILVNKIMRRAYPWAIATVVFFLTPVLGWVFFIHTNADYKNYGFFSWRYIRSLRKIKKLRGKDFFPSAEFHEYLENPN